MDRFQRRPIPQPLLKQQSCCCTVESAAAVPGQTMALSGSPCTGMLVNPGQGELKDIRQTLLVTTAVDRLRGGLAFSIQRKTHHKTCHSTLQTMFTDDGQIKFKGLSVNGLQRCDGDPKRVTTGKANPPPADIETENRTRRRHDQRRPRLGVGKGVWPGRRRPRT